jgi:ubiquinone/menaquinone biosynthesis C-methylase UbiE
MAQTLQDRVVNSTAHWSEELSWRDPVTGQGMHMLVSSRHPTGRPLSGALQVAGTRTGYPIVYGIPRLTAELAEHYSDWLKMFNLEPPPRGKEQALSSVDSFGFEWNWDSEPRTESDLEWRVATRHGLTSKSFKDHFMLDAGGGAGDQSRWILNHGKASRLISLDLSEAINVAYKKLEHNPNWLGVQGDLTALPFVDKTFSFVYCEGVIQHTRDSRQTVTELVRVLKPGGKIIATHYGLPVTAKGRAVHRLREALRSRLTRLNQKKLLFVTGCLAAIAHLPVIGKLWGRTVAVTNPLMPNFNSSWSCTYDAYGSHSFQRHLSDAEFADYFKKIESIRIIRQNGTEILAERDK